MRRLTLLLAGLFLPSLLLAGKISGHVFFDANADGQYQAGEAPVPGALVSDGLTILAPGADGAYQLQSPDGRQVVFVINPSGTWPTAGFSRYMPTGAGQADFPLARQEQQQPFHFIHGTDLHVYDSSEAQMARYVKTINELAVPVAFVMHTGDLAVDTNGVPLAEGERRLKGYQQMVAPLRMPLLNLPGNHEHAGVSNATVSPTEPDWGKGLYRRLFGPMYYAFNYAGIGFIALDGTDVSTGKLVYGIPQECLDWLRLYLQHLDPAVPLVMAIHEPFFTLGPQKAEVEKLLAGRKVLMALSGHGHGLGRAPFAGGMETEGGAVSYAWHGGGFGPNAMAYHLVLIGKDGFVDAMGDWAEPYPVTVTAPARTDVLKDTARLEVRFLDLKNEVTAAEVAFGDAKREITKFLPAGLSRSFGTDLSFPGLCDGVYDLVITLRGLGEPMVERQPFVVLTGVEEPFEAVAPAQLNLRLYNVSAANIVKVNGEEVGKLPAGAKSGEGFELEVPARLLQRLNTVEFVPAALPDGKYDNFSALYVTLTYQAKKASDPRTIGVTIPGGDKAETRAMYFDLK